MNALASPVELERPAFTPGVVPDLPDVAYHATEAMSYSGTKKMLRSPQHFLLARQQPSEPTAAMIFGKAVHCGALEPERFATTVVCAPDCNTRTNAGKAELAAFEAEHAGAIILKPGDFDRARRCVDAVLAHPMARELMAGAQREVSLFWFDGKYGTPCKARLDLLNGHIADIKTTTDASPEGFARQAAQLLYHVQAAFYNSGLEHVANTSMDFFANIAVESEPPHAVACYTIPGNAVLAGARLMNTALERYAAALKTGEWSGYPTELYALKFPKYALTFDL